MLFGEALFVFGSPAFFSARLLCSCAAGRARRQNASPRASATTASAPHAALRRRMESAIWLASDSLSAARLGLGGFHIRRQFRFGLLDGRVGASSAPRRRPPLRAPAVACGAAPEPGTSPPWPRAVRFVLRGLGGRLLQALLGEFARALGGLVALVQHLLQWLEENALQIEVQQNHQQKGRHCSQQYSAQGVQHGIHDFVLRRNPSKLLSRIG